MNIIMIQKSFELSEIEVATGRDLDEDIMFWVEDEVGGNEIKQLTTVVYGGSLIVMLLVKVKDE